jgi:threonine aldolase
MRQAGYLAAAGIYALKNNIERLEQDHAHAKLLAEALSKKAFVEEVLPVESNIIIFKLGGKYDPKSLVAKMKEKDIWWYAISPTQVRIVTHLDISREMIDETIDAIEQL